MKNELENLQQQFKDALNKIPNVSISADIATTKGMRSSYIAIIAHYISDGILYCVGLDLMEMSEKHCGLYIKKLVEQVLDNYNFNERKVFRYVSDSAANMKAAFM